MNTVARGQVAELALAKELTQRGLMVSIPLNHSGEYDLIVDTGIRLLRVQCKRAYKVDNHGKEQLCVETRRILVKHSGEKGSVARRYSDNAFDLLVAYYPDTDEFWMIPRETVGDYKAQIYLRTQIMDGYKSQWFLLGGDVSS